MCNTHKCLLDILFFPPNPMAESSNDPSNNAITPGNQKDWDRGDAGDTVVADAPSVERVMEWQAIAQLRKTVPHVRDGRPDPSRSSWRPAITLATQPSGLLRPAPLPVPGLASSLGDRCAFPGGTVLGVRFRVEGGGARRRAGVARRGAWPRRRPSSRPGLGAAMESGGWPSLGQFILLGTSSVVTAVLYSLYRQKAQVARELKVSANARLTSAGHPARGNGEPPIRRGPFHPRKRSKRRKQAPRGCRPAGRRRN